ncbi:MAG: class I SAM-dependent methyltransferase [Candidatus Helarchaeota archaeon]
MNSKLKQIVRHFHLSLDSFVGRVISQQDKLEKTSVFPHKPLTPKEFPNFRYSKADHYKFFRTLPVHAKQSPATCDLKVYQDALVYTFILDNLPSGACILEIGGGESRIINELKGQYEIWNLDKLEGSGFGPKDLITTNGFHLVQDYIGNHSPYLPDSYFDLIFSISTIEHLPQKSKIVNNAIDDIMRLLKPGGYSLHCIDALLYHDHYFVHPFVSKVNEQELVDYQEVMFEELTSGNELWVLPAYAFYTRWFHLVKKTMRNFGYPFSINILWQK